jgi:hypothetical protein
MAESLDMGSWLMPVLWTLLESSLVLSPMLKPFSVSDGYQFNVATTSFYYSQQVARFHSIGCPLAVPMRVSNKLIGINRNNCWTR